ncbi:MAG: alkaline phosphatase family protein [Phycisphaerales bacterium]
MSSKATLFCLALALQCVAAAAPDHIVVVIEENRAGSQIIGNPEAPFLNRLASQGAVLTDFFALTHPSQPNYLHLFAGDSLGIRTNDIPPGIPLSDPNLGAALLAAGRTFVSFSEDLPYAGFNGATFDWYARKHNPCANWQSDAPGPNQFPLSINQPFSNFPSDFTSLPTVSFVIPNLRNDMHDGTIEDADAWLEAEIGPYALWAMANNSLLIVTWDEDEFAQRNQIPTIFYGPMVRQGRLASTGTLHNLLRTIGDLYGALPPASAAAVRPIPGIFQSDPHIRSVLLQRSPGGHIVRDTYLDASVPSGQRGTISPLIVAATPVRYQGLVRFDTLVGRESNRVPPGATVLSAKLKLLTGTDELDSTLGDVAAHRMYRAWSENSSWNSMGGGVQLDGVEASASPEFVVLPNVSDAWAIFDVTRSVQEMVLDPATNQGWVLIARGGDNWRLIASESPVLDDRPALQVSYIEPVCDGDLNGDGAVDDQDFVLFAQSYDRLFVPPASAFADFTGDGQVDDSDFVRFADAHLAMICP